MNEGPIFIIDEDIDDHDLIKEMVKELNYSNEIVSFFLRRTTVEIYTDK